MSKVNKVFKEYADRLTAGRVIVEEDLCEWFGIKQPMVEGMNFKQTREAVNHYQFQKLAAYSGLNKLLRPVGIVISQRKNDYIVRGTKETVAPVIDSYKKRAATLTNNASILKSAYRRG